MDILLQPDSLSLVGSMSNFVIYSESDVVFIIKDHDSNRVIVQHTYNPSDTNRVEVNVKNIVQPLLAFDMRDSTVAWQQANIIKTFDVTVYNVAKEGVISVTKNVSFNVIRAGVDKFADSAENFLKQNFLTWQPNMKAVTYYSPEYLTYYAVVASVVKCKTYKNGTETNIALADIAAGTCWTIPVTYSVIAGKTNDLPEYYDIWVEDAQCARLTYIQRYYASDIKSEDEEWFLFENSLGGVDSFRAYGDNQTTAEHTHNIAEIEDTSEEYRVDTNRKHKKNTGFIDKKERSWLLDFFPSLAKYVYAGSALRRITVTESDASYTSSDTPSSYSFTYKLSDTNPYLNLPRADIPQGAMDIKVPDVGSFTIAPRLVEFPRQTLSGGALFPVQNPYSENWAVTTAAALFTFIVNQLEANYANNGRIGHTHPNIDLLNGLSVLEGYLLSDGNKIKASFADDVAEASATLKKFLRNDKDGDANGVIDFKQGLKIAGKAIAAIITSKDTTEYADTNIFSSLKACATFLRKDKEDVTKFLVKFLGGIITDSIKSQNFLQGILGAGFGLFFDGSKSYLQVDKLLVTTKAIFASLEIRKLSYVGGNFIFSAAGATLTKVEEISTGWRCYIHTDDGTTATSNMWAVGDMAKCQTFNVKPGVYANVSNRYYWRKVDAVGDNYIDISATDHDTSVDNDVPQVGDVLVQQGNKTDPTRQNMNAIMTVGEDAPAFIQYIGINDYDLNSHRRITISPKGNTIIADSYLVEIDGKQETLATAAALKVLADSITESVTSIKQDLAGKLNPRGEWAIGEYKANDQVTLNGQMFVALIDNSDCPIVPLTDENGAYLVDENNNIIVPVDENGHMTYSSSWKPYTSNEALEDNLKEFKTGTQATFKIMSDNIDSKVSSTTFNALGKIVNQQSSDISQFPSKITESISTSVEENGIIYKAVTSSFALDGNKVKIFGKEIDISGAVVFTDISNEIKDAKDTATQANEELSDYKAAMVTTINGLQSQIDGEVDSWFNQVDPTTSNIPASEWTTDVLKQRHANDTYTNTNTGASWKWILTNNVWGWTPIADTATQKALANAAKAQDTADGKRRVFTVQPTSDSAYEIGDVWVNATYGTMFTNDFLVCLTAKATGAAFNITHWKLASKYTDDTSAKAAQKDAKSALDYRETFAKNIGYTSLADMENVAQNEHVTIIKGGKVNTDLLEVDVILAKALQAKIVDAKDATIENLKVVNVELSGNFCSPMYYVNGIPNAKYHNNICITGGSNITLHDRVENVGRLIRIIYSYKSDGTLSNGRSTILTNGSKIYEDGMPNDSIIINREIVELLGMGNDTTFFGWQVLNRIDSVTEHSYGRKLKVIAEGVVTGSSTGASIRGRCWDSRIDFAVSRQGVGIYVIAFTSDINIDSANDIIVMATGVGHAAENVGGAYSPIKATVAEVVVVNGTLSITIITSDDATANDGSFNFMITNMNDFGVN